MSPTKTSEQIRAEFFDFFREKDHEIVSSASLVPHNDPTLLFTNAGMNQFKDVFLGTGERPYRRAADTQKCLRVSGKHNDLEEVGIDTYHHTFFEMLGNWSFGDYFKKEAIAWAWELLVDRWGLDSSRLYVTVHEGDEALGLGADEEAAGFWKSETSIDPDHVLFCGSKDNFWAMGDTGPCGPCSEIHIDLRSQEERDKVPGASLVNADDPRVMEIWNLVFIQYDARRDGSLEPLPAQHVDTGMGFERLVAVLQDKRSNYDTDLFAPLLARIAELTPRPDIESYFSIDAEGNELEKVKVAMRVIADHARTITFAIADGVMPGNVGRGYVIRRILRRAVRFGYQTLELREPFLHTLVGTIGEQMATVFPEVGRRREYVEQIVRAEEESFLNTLGTGLAFFDRIVPLVKQLAAGGGAAKSVRSELEKDRRTTDLLEKSFVQFESRAEVIKRFEEVSASGVIPGEIAFLLHDTYGFPVDLTHLMAREEGLGVDMNAYQELMRQQKDRARSAATFIADDDEDESWREISRGEASRFVGYDSTAVDGALIRKIRTVHGVDGAEVHEVVLNQTPFYAESGGQVGDAGHLTIGDRVIRVIDTRRIGDEIVHFVEELPGDLDGPVTAEVDASRRTRIMKHHTATHLLHAALREVLGPHVGQKGSLVAPDHLRFDFSHFERVTPSQLEEIARLVNAKIQENIEKGEERSVPRSEALERGAMALFGEKYGDTVRVITFDPSFSIELCGGTHVDATGQIGLFTFTSEGSVAAGVRRVEAMAGFDALGFLNAQIEELDRVRDQFKAGQRPTDEEVADLLDRYKEVSKELERVRGASLASQLDDILATASKVDGVRIAVGNVGTAAMEDLRILGQQLRDRSGEGTVGVLGSTDPEGGKVFLVATVSDDLIREKGLKAGDLVGRLAKVVGGGGGGRPELATAGGKIPSKLDEALAEAPDAVQSSM